MKRVWRQWAKWGRVHPRLLPYLFACKVAERGALYGILSVLMLQLIGGGLSQSAAMTAVLWFAAGAALAPVAGGWVGDRIGWRFGIVVLSSLSAAVGYALLWTGTPAGLAAGAFLVAVGIGGIDPNLPALLAQCYDEHPRGTEGRDVGLTVLYWATNLGSCVFSVAFPVLRTQFGPTTPFLVASALSLTSGFALLLGARHRPATLGATAKYAGNGGTNPWLRAPLPSLFLVTVAFFAVLNQETTVWVLFAREHMDLTFCGLSLEPDHTAAFNPLIAVWLIPLSIPLWRWAERRFGTVSHAQRIRVGVAFGAVGMVVMAGAAWASNSGQVSVGWAVAAMALLTAGEICLSVSGLEMAIATAGPRNRGTVVAGWILAYSMGSIVASALASLYTVFNPAVYFIGLALALATTVRCRLGTVGPVEKHSRPDEQPGAEPSAQCPQPIEAESER